MLLYIILITSLFMWFWFRDAAISSPFVHPNLMTLQPFAIQVVQLEPQKCVGSSRIMVYPFSYWYYDILFA